MAATQGASGPAATITGQRQGTGLDSTGSYVAGWTVEFKTAKGQMGQVFVPASSYSRDAVHAAVKAQAQEMDSVLGSEVV